MAGFVSRFGELTEEFDVMRSYIESESRRRQAAKRKVLNRTDRRIRKWARFSLYSIGLAFCDPVIPATFMLLIAAMIAAFLLSNADFANPAIGMPVTISIFGLGIAGYNIGAKSRERSPRRVR